MLIAIDPGHGGTDPGAVYNGRNEKDDVLKLAKAVGKILTESGIDVMYTREEDVYETPFKKAQDGNNSGADYFISFHRNSSEYPNQYAGAEMLVYSNTGIRRRLADNILMGMEEAGFRNLGIDERKDLVVLKRTRMPAVLIEAGFVNSDSDNKLFDENFDRLAKGIADGILATVYNKTYEMKNASDMKSVSDMNNNYDVNNYASDMENYPEENYTYDAYGRGCNCPCADVLYRVQTGAFKNRENADRMLNSLLMEEFPAFIVYDDGLYKVQVGAYRKLTNAITMEGKLREYRYSTYITTT